MKMVGWQWIALCVLAIALERIPCKAVNVQIYPYSHPIKGTKMLAEMRTKIMHFMEVAVNSSMNGPLKTTAGVVEIDYDIKQQTNEILKQPVILERKSLEVNELVDTWHAGGEFKEYYVSVLLVSKKTQDSTGQALWKPVRSTASEIMEAIVVRLRKNDSIWQIWGETQIGGELDVSLGVYITNNNETERGIVLGSEKHATLYIGQNNGKPHWRINVKTMQSTLNGSMMSVLQKLLEDRRGERVYGWWSSITHVVGVGGLQLTAEAEIAFEEKQALKMVVLKGPLLYILMEKASVIMEKLKELILTRASASGVFVHWYYARYVTGSDTGTQSLITIEQAYKGLLDIIIPNTLIFGHFGLEDNPHPIASVEGAHEHRKIGGEDDDDDDDDDGGGARRRRRSSSSSSTSTIGSNDPIWPFDD